MKRSRVPLAVMVLMAVLVGSCSRGSELGPNDAVEILVIDGIDRAQAVCMVSDLAGKISLEKITGVDTTLSAEEIATLAASSAACKLPLVGGGGVVSGTDPGNQLEGGGLMPDRSRLVSDLVRGGMDPVIAECLADSTLAAPDPVAALGDKQYRAKALLECESNPDLG